MNRKEKLKQNLENKAKQKAWKTAKKLGKSYLKYKAVTGTLKYGKKKLLSRKKSEE